MPWKQIHTLEDLRASLSTAQNHTSAPPPAAQPLTQETKHLEIPYPLLHIMGAAFFQHLKAQHPQVRWRWDVGDQPALAMRAIQTRAAHEIIFRGAREYAKKLHALAQKQDVILLKHPAPSHTLKAKTP